MMGCLHGLVYICFVFDFPCYSCSMVLPHLARGLCARVIKTNQAGRVDNKAKQANTFPLTVRASPCVTRGMISPGLAGPLRFRDLRQTPCTNTMEKMVRDVIEVSAATLGYVWRTTGSTSCERGTFARRWGHLPECLWCRNEQ